MAHGDCPWSRRPATARKGREPGAALAGGPGYWHVCLSARPIDPPASVTLTTGEARASVANEADDHVLIGHLATFAGVSWVECCRTDIRLLDNHATSSYC